MESKNILIFPAGSEIAFEINNALKYCKFVNIFAGSSVHDHAEFIYQNCDCNFPFFTESNFIDYLNQYIDKNRIEYIYPALDMVQVFLTNHANEIHATIVTSPSTTVNTCRSKKLTYELLQKEDFIPKTYNSLDEIENYPVFIKPIEGQGAEGAHKINSADELKFALIKNPDIVICEYLENTEYTIDCFTDKSHKLQICLPRSRDRIKTGISVRSTSHHVEPEIRQIAETINSYFEFNGAWFFQLKKNYQGEYKLLEISPRIPGTMGLSRNLGINFPLLTLFNMWGFPLQYIKNDYNIVLDRAFISRYHLDLDYDNVYIDFDDLIIVRGKVNLSVIRFLYQLVNTNKNIYLLTRHRSDIFKSLQKYKISPDIFTDIISIGDDRPKSDFINSEKSIFIDDSFRERLEVKQKLGIPVFDVDMIEGLIDWRV